jgi:RNA polymerase sigma-70 factor (ECF subfamily)
MTRNNKDVSNDIIQDVFYKVLNSPHKFNVNKKFHPWIFTVTANECRKHFRFPVHESIEDKTNVETSEFTIEKLDLTVFKRKIDVLLEEVNDRQKEAFILRHQESFTLQEIAEIQDCAIGTIKSRLHYTTKYLADNLEVYKALLKTSDYGRL